MSTELQRPWKKIEENIEEALGAAKEGDHDRAMNHLTLATRYVWISHVRLINAKKDVDVLCGVTGGWLPDDVPDDTEPVPVDTSAEC